jgi:hypothetical protein
MIRHRLTDEQWERIAPLIPGKPGDPGRTGDNNRLFVDAAGATDAHASSGTRSGRGRRGCSSFPPCGAPSMR